MSTKRRVPLRQSGSQINAKDHFDFQEIQIYESHMQRVGQHTSNNFQLNLIKANH